MEEMALRPQKEKKDKVSKRQELQQAIDQLNAQLTILNSVPTDSFPVGTVVVFSSDNNTRHWYYRKLNNELWTTMLFKSKEEKPLEEWILQTTQSDIGYFEVYVLTVAETPFYASS